MATDNELQGKGSQKESREELLAREKKQIELALQESEERYHSILNVSPDAIIIHFKGEIVFANQLALQKTGAKKQEDIVGKPAIEFVHPDDRKAAIKRIGEMYENGESAPIYEERMIKMDGSVLYVEVVATLIPYKGSKASLVVLRDISERKKAEDELNESRSLYFSFIEQLPNPVFRKNKKGEYILVNSRFCKLKNLKEEELIGRKPAEIEKNFISGNDNHNLAAYAKRGEKIHQKILKTGQSYEEEEEYPGPDGNTIYMDAKRMPVVDSNGNIIGSQGIMFDITDRKKAEKELQNSYDLLNKLTAQVPGVVYQYRLYPDGRSAFPVASSGMWDIYEVTPEEVREDASPVFTRIHPDDYDMIVKTINESAKNLTLYHSEFRVILPKQGLRWRLCDAKPERLEDGSTLWYGIISDITERKQAEEELQKYRHQLEELVKERTSDLEQKNKELEKFNDLFVGREFRIKELKNKVEELEQQIKDKV